MPFDATPGSPAATSYATEDELDDYLEFRRGGATLLADATPKEALLVSATRIIDMVCTQLRTYDRVHDYYVTRPYWTGTPTNDDQALAWPRTGMFNRNGFPIDPDEIPKELKDAVCELAFQLYTSDTTLDNAVSVQGITSIKAGPVALAFKDSIETTKMLPDAVLFLLVPSWLTDVLIEGLRNAIFKVY